MSGGVLREHAGLNLYLTNIGLDAILIPYRPEELTNNTHAWRSY